MEKQIIYIIALVLIVTAVSVIYFSRNIIAKIKNINDTNSANRLIKIIGIIVIAVSLYVIYINR